jgi:hypothetical protein
MRVLPLVSLALAGLAPAAAADEPGTAAPAPTGEGRPAHAVGPIVLEGSGEVPGQFIDRLRGEAQVALDASEVRTVPRDAVAAILRTVPELATCGTRECVARLALATSAGRILTLRLAVTGELFDITVELVDDHGRPLRRRATRCVACTLNDALARTTAAIRDLAGNPRDDEVPVTIRSTPPEAGVTIDGTWVGATPWAGPLVAGPHHVVVSGSRTVVRDVFVEAGDALQLEIATGSRRRFGWIAYGAAGAGAAALIGGASLLAIDGDGTCAQASCPRVYETSTLGWGLTAVGVAALGAAGWMIWHDHRGGHAAVVPTDGGAAAIVGGRF